MKSRTAFGLAALAAAPILAASAGAEPKLLNRSLYMPFEFVLCQHLEKAVGLDPGDRESTTLLSLLRADAVPGEGAGLGRVLRDETFITLAFGRLCLEQGLADEAALVLTRVLRRDPDNAEARAQLETALRARSRRRG